MKIWLKIIIAVVAGGIVYLLTNVTKQPEIWKITMSVFVAGVVLVVQVLVEAVEHIRRLAESAAAEARRAAETATSLSAASALLIRADGQLGGHVVTRLVDAAAGLDRAQPAQIRFAEHQINRLTSLLVGLRSGRAKYKGGDRDWLLGLTETARTSIEATSMTSFTKFRGFVDEGPFWTSELGRRYLQSQRRAIAERGVQIRRVFLVSAAETVTAEQINELLKPHKRINVETRILFSHDLDSFMEGTLTDFILFDDEISYDLHSASSLNEDVAPLINTVELTIGEEVQDRRDRFKEIWEAAEPA